MLEWLEEYQRDLEQEVADVADHPAAQDRAAADCFRLAPAWPLRPRAGRPVGRSAK
jgi:hypothetical protein